ncbi:MAG: hypothetical protein G01um101444_142 [Parcubacteria group bacterium Gr01-1014_44]|nr:MAG: hypothetical protein G01um101444_142 [Parcubacteria group bacterium Gr01-1014_44]
MTKRWTGVVVLIILAGLVTWGLLNLPTIINAVQGKLTAWQYQRQLDALEKPYKTDKIGGQTPEETFDLFISALKKEDVDLASKYFVIKKQDDWKKTLEEYRNKALLSDFIVELEKDKSEWNKRETKDPKIIEFDTYTTIKNDAVADFNGQKIPIEAGKYLNTTRFEKYPTGVWKINLL